jgi:DNA processing protein
VKSRFAVVGNKRLLGTVKYCVVPLNNILPAKNRSLAFEIVEEGGLLVSEYFDEHKSAMDLSGRYKDRDRLQALFCDAIILAASYAQDTAERWKMFGQKLDSGARLAMGFAKDYNILRAVMYDQKLDSDNPMFDLNRQLIAEQKAITILTQKTLEDLINKVKSKNNNTAIIQANLFD